MGFITVEQRGFMRMHHKMVLEGRSPIKKVVGVD